MVAVQGREFPLPVLRLSIQKSLEVVEFIREKGFLCGSSRVNTMVCCMPTTKTANLSHMSWRSHLRLVEYTQLPELEVGSGSRRVIVTHLI